MMRSVLLIAGLCGVLAGCSVGSRGSAASTQAGSATHLVSYRDRRLGWTTRYPGSFQAGHFHTACCTRVSADGEWFANFNADIRGGGNGSTVPDMTRLRAFPTNGVALAIWRLEGGLQGRATRKTTAVPINPNALHLVGQYVGGAEPSPRFAGIYDHGSNLAVAVWIGRRASPTDRNAIWATLARLRLPQP